MSEKEASLDLNASYIQLDTKKGLVEEIPSNSKEFGSLDTGIEVPKEIIQVAKEQRENRKEQVAEQTNESEVVGQRRNSSRELMNSKDDGMTL